MKFVDSHWYLRHSSANAIISATTVFILWEGGERVLDLTCWKDFLFVKVNNVLNDSLFSLFFLVNFTYHTKRGVRSYLSSNKESNGQLIILCL